MYNQKFSSYEAVAAGQTDEVIGAGDKGNYLARLIITVSTAATGIVSIKDGAGSAIPITVTNTPIGVYSIDIGATCVTSWKVTTGAGASVLAVGRFQPYA